MASNNIVEEKEDEEEDKNDATASSLLYTTNTNRISIVLSSLSTMAIANDTEANVREKGRQRSIKSIKKMKKIKEEARKAASYTTTNGIKCQQKLKIEKINKDKQ